MRHLEKYSFVIIHLMMLFCLVISFHGFGQTITQSPLPLSGHYPGGHVGLRGGDSPEPGVVPFYFNRTYVPGNLKDSQGNTIGSADKVANGNIFGLAWNTKIKVLGMYYGGILGIPITDIYNRPNGQVTTGTSTGLGLGDIVLAPLGLFGKSKKFDYQIGVGTWLGTGSYTYGSASNHGSGFSEMIYSVGGVYYPDGNRKSFSISAIARIEQTFKQKTTGVNPGDDVVIDWGIGSPYIPLDKAHKHITMFGVSGFTTFQFTKESGTYAAIDNNCYQVYAAGPEFNYAFRPARVKFILRAQWEFAAKNTTQGATYWVAVMYKFKNKASKE